jgi:hypothetical protein
VRGFAPEEGDHFLPGIGGAGRGCGSGSLEPPRPHCNTGGDAPEHTQPAVPEIRLAGVLEKPDHGLACHVASLLEVVWVAQIVAETGKRVCRARVANQLGAEGREVEELPGEV